MPRHDKQQPPMRNSRLFYVTFRMSEKEFNEATKQHLTDNTNENVIDYYDYIGDKMIDLSYTRQDNEDIPNDHVFMDLGYQNMETTTDEQGNEVHEHVLMALYLIRATKDHPSLEDTIQGIKDYAASLEGMDTKYISYEERKITD